MGNKVTLTFAGDATSMEAAAKRSDKAVGGVGAAADASGKQLAGASKSSADLGTKMGHLGSAVSGAGDAFDAVGGSLQAVVDLQQAGIVRASRLARAINDVEQAQEDFNQALRDGAQSQLDSNQAAIDLEQASIDASTSLKEYNAAVKEFGSESDEARQAALDLKQANLDAAQAQEDGAQATRDASQATIDAKGAQLDLADAQREAKPPELQKWADQLNMVTPLLTAVAGVVGLVTAAQWAWNIAQLASPTTWIILGIVALIAVIVLIATKTTWFQDAWKVAWGWIKRTAVDVWDWLKTLPDKIGATFSKLAGLITWPFRTAFNLISDAWNNTVGSLRWTVPGWVPGIGGNTVGAPQLPKFHSGGVVPGAPGSEMLAVLQAGERVTPAGSSGRSLGPDDLRMPSGSGMDRLFLSWLQELLRRNSLRLTSAA